jgi:hypothetical protein
VEDYNRQLSELEQQSFYLYITDINYSKGNAIDFQGVTSNECMDRFLKEELAAWGDEEVTVRT